ncbi:MAG: CoA pyrophosphatase [Anaerolineales bacterium]
MTSKINSLTEFEISERLAKALSKKTEVRSNNPSFPSELFQNSPLDAAVLIPILKKDKVWHLLFTRRTSSLPEHSGQVAFPGGRSDPGDASPEVTALREAEEEINLTPGNVNILGKLQQLRTISNYCVFPVVGRIPWPYEFLLAREEVSRIFTIPLEWLADPNNHNVQLRELPSPHSPVPVIYFDRYEGELLWGISAQITINFLFSLNLL